MKYESSILKRLIDTYGVIGNPCYLSEIIKEFIVRGKELYPQLFTYQSDWLAHIDEFGLTPEYTVSYTGQHIYAPNTKEKPVKSAILKGQTLVNIVDFNHIVPVIGATISDKVVTLDKSKTNSRIEFKTTHPSLVANKQYTVVLCDVNGDTSTLSACVQTNSGVAIKTPFINNKAVVTMDEGNKNRLFYVESSKNVADTTVSFKIMIIEGNYTNADIPYFEGMQSVKLPVLKTTGKNLWNPKKMFVYENLIDNTYSMQTLDFLQIGKTYVIKAIKTDKCQNRKVWIKYAGNKVAGYNLISEGNPTSHLSKGFIYTGVETLGIYTEGISKKDMCSILHDEYNFFIYENGTHSDVYEPYKSNILSCNEDVILRGIGDVQDTLNCLTGELTERIGEIVLDGSEGERWAIYTNNREKTVQFRFDMKSTAKGQSNYTKIISNNLPNVDIINNNDTEGVSIYSNGNIYISLLRTKATTLSDLNLYLQSNPITIQYELAEKSIKTVALTIHDKDHQKVERLTTFEGGTHFTTSSQDGSLLPTLTVDVVTDLEKTMMVCSLEGNTM